SGLPGASRPFRTPWHVPPLKPAYGDREGNRTGRTGGPVGARRTRPPRFLREGFLDLFFPQDRVHLPGFVLADRFFRPLHPDGQRPTAEADFQHVARFHLAAGFGLPTVKKDAPLPGHVLRYRAPFDQPRDFEKLVEPHSSFHGFFELVARLERRNLGSRNLDLLARLRVAAHAAGTLAGFEGAEADQLDLLALRQR